MGTVRIDGAVWLTPARRGAAAEGSGRAGLWGRTLGLVGAVGGVVMALASAGSPVEAARSERPVQSAAPAAAAEKIPSRLPDVAAAAAAQPDRFRPGGDVRAALAAAQAFAAPVDAGWRDGAFSDVAVVDGRTFESGGVRIRLAGIDLPAPSEMCRTLDGRLEPCAARAATQLELLVRWRSLACRYRPEGAADGVGECRLGSGDLAERMLRTGFVRRAGEPARAALAAKAAD